jgi:hypothetical protein
LLPWLRRTWSLTLLHEGIALVCVVLDTSGVTACDTISQSGVTQSRLRCSTAANGVVRQIVVTDLAQGVVTGSFEMSRRRSVAPKICGLRCGDSRVTFSTIKVTITVVVVTVEVCLTCCDEVAVNV